MEDRAKSLKDPAEREARKQMLNQEHIKPLTNLVDEIKREQPGKDVPCFDPLDGGVKAQCLFVLESPGRMTKSKSGSGFISRNNNDETAKNFFEMNEAAEIPRRNTVTWNIVPWDISENGKRRAPSSAEIEIGLAYLYRLMDRLPNLRVIVLVGDKAKKVIEDLKAKRSDIEILHCPHPSPSNLNTRPQMRPRIIEVLMQVREYIDGPA